MGTLPIHRIQDDFIQAQSEGNRIILSAPTGSGKSTQIPQMLLDHCCIEGKILTLQPRRIAARMLANRVAHERNSTLGTEIGFQTRFESSASRDTKVLFITEGILPRMFLSNPELTGIGAVILDEFHERSINNDIGLGLVKVLQEKDRPDLKLIIMSATLEIDELQDFLDSSISLSCEGRQFPIDVQYHLPQPREAIWDSAALALKSILSSGKEGDVLIFMPGAYEINKTLDACRNLKTPERLAFLPLYGNLPAEQQDEIMNPSERRKIIISTNIAETSLTIPGICNVIDSGLVRVNRFDPSRGFNTLHIESISKASASQRSGRAGRLGPGRCLRLWSSREHSQKKDQNDPEICRIDLAETLLHLKAIGFENIHHFPWLTSPKKESVDESISLLILLEALDKNTLSLTPLGEKLAKFPTHPRIARMLLESHQRHCLKSCSLIAAILSERPVTLSDKQAQQAFNRKFDETLNSPRNENVKPVKADLFAIMNALDHAQKVRFSPDPCQKAGIKSSAARQVWRTFDFFLKVCRKLKLNSIGGSEHPEDSIQCLIVGFPDHLAKCRTTGSLAFQLRDDQYGELHPNSLIRNSDLILAAEIREIGKHKGPKKLQLSMVCEVKAEWLIDLFPDHWNFEKKTLWNPLKKVIERKETDRCLNLIIQEKTSTDVDPELSGKLLADAILKEDLSLEGWNKEVKTWIQRVHCVSEWFPERQLPIYDKKSKEKIISNLCYGNRRYEDVKKKPFLLTVKNLLSYEEQKLIETMAPDKFLLPSGRRMPVKYRPGQAPKGNAKIQDLYGLKETPLAAGGKIKMLIEILGPNMRPVQVTDDLAGFWKNLYPEIKKELSRRYPKHEWR